MLCPHCQQEIKNQAIKCRHCKQFIESSKSAEEALPFGQKMDLWIHRNPMQANIIRVVLFVGIIVAVRLFWR